MHGCASRVRLATPLGEALCCDVTLVSLLTREGRPQPSAATRDGAAITVAERRKRIAYPELLRPGCNTGVRQGIVLCPLLFTILNLGYARSHALFECCGFGSVGKQLVGFATGLRCRWGLHGGPSQILFRIGLTRHLVWLSVVEFVITISRFMMSTRSGCLGVVQAGSFLYE